MQCCARFRKFPRVVEPDRTPDGRYRHNRFFDTEFFVDLSAQGKVGRPIFHQDKERLIAAMDRELEKVPGSLWGFSQPISDNVEEAVSGVKGELAVEIYGDDLKTLEAKADEIVTVMQNVQGVQDLGVFRVVGQPNLNFTVDRNQASRYAINVSDIQDAIQTAVGGYTPSAKCCWENSDTILSCVTCRPIGTRGKPSRRFACSLLPVSGFRWHSSRQ